MRRLVPIACAAMAAFAGVTASSAPDMADPPATPTVITVPVYYLSGTGKLLPPEDRPKDLDLLLGAIPGSIGGHPGSPLQTVHIGHEKVIRLDLTDLASKISAQVAQLAPQTGTSLKLEPPDTRFARVSQVVWFKSDRTVTLSIGFYDSQTIDGLTLLYFDRACRLSGSALSSKSSSEFDIETESAGLIWMRIQDDRPSHTMHSRALKPNPVLIIGPPEALDRLHSQTLSGK